MNARLEPFESDEHRMIRDAVRAIALPFGPSYWLDEARRGAPGDELWQALGGAGFVGVNLPAEYGGGGQGISELSIVLEELAAAGCPTLMIVLSSAMSGTILAHHGSGTQKQAWLPPIARGETRVAFALTEPEAGSNSHRITTSAQAEGDSWVLEGQKYYISGVDQADAVMVVARTGTDPTTGRASLSLFLVPTTSPGLTAQPLPTAVTMTERQFTLFFDDVMLPADALVGREGDGLRAMFSALNPERITAAATCNGLARYAISKAVTYANERSVWDVPIGTHQAIAHPLAESSIELRLARLITAQAAYLFDRGDPGAGEAANAAKYWAAEAGGRALDRAIQTLGGNGMSTEYELAEYWSLMRLLRIIPVSREMILNYVAQHSLGLPRSY